MLVGARFYCFPMWSQMKQLKLAPNKWTYTALFNACANSPFGEEALKQANELRDHIAEQQIPLQRPTFHAMIKAYARHADLANAFAVVDEMVRGGILPDEETFGHMLSACVSSKE